jgi:serine/threonine protein kinase
MNFFQNLFGKKPEPSPNRQNPAVARQGIGREEAAEFYKKGDLIGGNFEVRGVLGKGGFGVVYLVFNRDTKELDALKTFRDEFLPDSAAREAFKKEVSTWVNLGLHPFILCAQSVNESNGRLFVRTSYIAPDSRGCVTLADHLAIASGPLETN